MHGRPRALAGRYYSSLFIHYKPVDWALTLDDAIVRVPPHWLERGADVAFPRLAIRGTGFYEDECLDQWRARSPRARAPPTRAPDALGE